MDNLRRNDFGFTFIEILIVIIISGMLIGLSTASAKEILLKGNTEKAVFEMYSDICALRNESIFTYKQSRVRFYMNYNNTNQSAYVLHFMENNIWKTKERIILNKNQRIFSLTFPGSSVNQNFSYHGTPLYSGSVGLKGNNGEVYYLVFYNSGRIRIKESV